MPIGAYYPKREASANPGAPRGLSHYPQHIIAQAEAQKGQQQANGSANVFASTSSSFQQDGSKLAQNALQSNHSQAPLPPASSSKGLNIQHYQPVQKTQAPSQVQKRVTRRSSNTSSAPPRNTRASTRVSQRQEQKEQQQQKQPVSVSAPDTSMALASEAIPTTFAGIMSQFPVPNLSVAETPDPAGG